MYLGPSRGKQVLPFVSVSIAAVFVHTLTCCSLGLLYYAVIAALSTGITVPLGAFLLVTNTL